MIWLPWLLVIGLAYLCLGLLTVLAQLVPHDREWRGWTPVVRVLLWPLEWLLIWAWSPPRWGR